MSLRTVLARLLANCVAMHSIFVIFVLLLLVNTRVSQKKNLMNDFE